MESEFVRVGDIDVCYEVHGSGPRLVLISGTGGDLRQNPLRAHHPLTKHFEVLMYDQRGLGRSGKPDYPYTMADYGNDAVGLMDALGWEHAHVVGMSFGGMVAQHVVLDHPGRVDGLVLMCTASGGDGGDSYDLLAINDLPAHARGEVMVPLLDRRNDLSTDPPTWAPMFDVLGPDVLKGVPLNADDPDSAMGARRQLEARAGHNTWDRLPEITAPTFVAGGDYDDLAPAHNLHLLAGRIPEAKLQFFNGGHLFMLQDPTTWPAVTTFLTTPT